MIQINLLPNTDKKGAGAKRAAAAAKRPGAEAAGGGGGGAAITFVTLLVFGAVGAAGYFAWNTVHEAKVKADRIAAEKKAVEKEIAGLSEKAEEIRKLREVFANQWEVLQSLDPPDRVLWSEKVNMLAHLIPTDVFLSNVTLQEQVVEVELKSSVEARTKWEDGGKKGPKPQIVKKPVITYIFRITGLATGGDNVQQFDNVLKFHDAMMAHESPDAQGVGRRFMENFDPEIEFEDIQATLYEGVPVNQFTFKLKTKSTMPAETADAEASAPAKQEKKKEPHKKTASADEASKPRG